MTQNTTRHGVRSTFLLLGVLGIFGSVRAVFQNDQQGFDSTHVFASAAGGENIDVLSGNLNLVIPLGPHYQLSNSFSYQVALSYNSKIWDHDCELVNMNDPCPGTLTAPTTYGLGFFPWFGRVYHSPKDKDWVWRLQTSDGSEHFFCAMGVTGASTDSECTTLGNGPHAGSLTSDAAHIEIKTYTTGIFLPPPNMIYVPSWFEVWLNDGTRMELKQATPSVPDWKSAKYYATRLATISTHGSPATPNQFVDVNYTTSTSSYISTIEDSQGRVITFTNPASHETHITFPGFGGSTSEYVLRFEDQSVKDPAPGTSITTSASVLRSVQYPLASERYEFSYTRGSDDVYGYLLQRRIPTGATFDYYYSHYDSSVTRRSHGEVALKILTLPSTGATYRWSYTRFPTSVIRTVADLTDYYNLGRGFSGTNPSRVRVLDPFDNLTDYHFYSSSYSSSSCASPPCPTNGSDGLPYEVATYVGPSPSEERLVTRVQYEWLWDDMFTYRLRGASGSNSAPPTDYEVAIRPRVETVTAITPGGGAYPPSTKRTESSDWCDGTEARQVDEYVDGDLYRQTFTHYIAGNSHPNNYDYSETKDAHGNVISHVDQKNSGPNVLCQIRRVNGLASSGVTGISNCASMSLDQGDVALRNTIDANTGTISTTEVWGGDDQTVRTSAMTYAAGGVLATKNLGFGWNAVDRTIDLSTGLTQETHDPAGNTVQLSWDALGRLTSIQPHSPEVATVISYPSLKETQVTQTVGAANVIQTIHVYDDLGREIQVRRRNATGGYDQQDTEYDVAGRVTQKSEWHLSTDPVSTIHWTAFDYTAWADPDPVPGEPGKYPDPLGRIHGITTPDDPTPNTPTVETTYQGLAKTVTVHDIRGYSGGESLLTSSTTYLNDALGRLVSVDAPGSAADAQYTYDESDRLIDVQLTDAGPTVVLQHRRFEYDRLGRMRHATNPETGTVDYLAYDATGNLLRFADASLHTFAMTYDAADRLLTRGQDTAGGVLPLLENSYDDVPGEHQPGKLIRRDSYEIENGGSSLVASTSFDYGPSDSAGSCWFGNMQPANSGNYSGLNGRIRSQSTTIQPWGSTLTTIFCQNAVGLPGLTGYPGTYGSDRTITALGFTYRNGYLVETHDEGRNTQFAKSIQYGPGGVPTDITRGNNEHDIIEYDIRNRPLRMKATQVAYPNPEPNPETPPGCDPEWQQVGGQMVPWESCGDPPSGASTAVFWDTGDFAYDMAGNIKSIGSSQYYYDESSRLTHAALTSGADTHTMDFAYDGFGNMLTQNRFSPGYTLLQDYTVLPQSNRLAGTSSHENGIWRTTTTTFDSNGNQTAESGRSFDFDSENRIREIADRGTGTIGAYDYDASGYRVRAQASGNETYFIRDEAGQVLSEFQHPVGGDGDPTWNKDYVYLFGKPFALIKNDLPAAPTRPWATSVTATSLTLHWNPVSEPDLLGYAIERHYKATGEASEVVTTIPLAAGVTSWSDTFANGKDTASIRYFLLAMDTAGNLSEPSAGLLIYPGSSEPPAIPDWIEATPGDRQVRVEWSDAAAVHDDVWGYYIDRRQPPGSAWTQLNQTPLSQTHYTDPARQNDHQYCYRIRAVDTSGRVASPSTEACATPEDIYPPAKLFGVTAEPDLAAGSMTVRWPASSESDIDHYVVYHRQGGAWAAEPPVSSSGASTYSWTLTGLPPGANDFAVTAVDGAFPVPNESEKSTPVSARPRVVGASLAAPTMSAPALQAPDQGTTPTTDCPGGVGNCCAISAESDDVIQVSLSWSSVSGASGYRVYKRAGTETHYRQVKEMTGGTAWIDTTITSGNNTYYVTAYNTSDESAASNQLSATDPFPTDYANSPTVRNIVVTDGRADFRTDNAQSRAAYVSWSRVVEADLVGYNVYRRCDPGRCPENTTYPSMEHFACDPVWERLNLAPITPDRRLYVDSDAGGMGGCYEYFVRPVGPNNVEGKVTKLISAQLGLDQTADSNALDSHCQSAASVHHDDATMSTWTTSDMLDATTAPLGINRTSRGSGSADTIHQIPTGATIQMLWKSAPMDISLGVETAMAKLSWTMPGDPSGAPSDLAGFYVDVAHSPSGPWSRASHGLVAWWERHYTMQGAAINYSYSDQGDCLSFRVIAVDENGNQSPPSSVVTYNPHGVNCSQVVDAPYELTVSTYALHTVQNQVQNEVKLQWKGVSGATQYSIYRLIMQPNHSFFYETQRQVAVGLPGTVQTYIEPGDWQGASDPDPNHRCYFAYYNSNWKYCPVEGLEAYYVTSRGAFGVESQRSRIVFWDSTDTQPYARLELTSEPALILASTAVHEGAESVSSRDPSRPRAEDPDTALGAVCSAADWASESQLMEAALAVLPSDESAGKPIPKDSLEVIPSRMIRLGSLEDPPWQLFNLHTDHLGTVRAVTSVSSGAAALHDYLPFGQGVSFQFSDNTLEYAGQERDHHSGLDYMKARYYNATIGRELTADPINPLALRELDSFKGVTGNWNKFAYARGNPLVLRDGTGKVIEYAPSFVTAYRDDPAFRSSHQEFIGNLEGGWIHDQLGRSDTKYRFEAVSMREMKELAGSRGDGIIGGQADFRKYPELVTIYILEDATTFPKSGIMYHECKHCMNNEKYSDDDIMRTIVDMLLDEDGISGPKDSGSMAFEVYNLMNTWGGCAPLLPINTTPMSMWRIGTYIGGVPQ